MCISCCSTRACRISTDLKDLADVPYYELEEIKHFFEVYKTLEPGKEVHGGEWVNHDAAQEEIVNSYNRFKQH